MPLSQNVRIRLARFLIKKRIPADVNLKDWYYLLHWLTIAAAEGKDEHEVRLANVLYARSIKRMIRRGWTTQAELDKRAERLQHASKTAPT